MFKHNQSTYNITYGVCSMSMCVNMYMHMFLRQKTSHRAWWKHGRSNFHIMPLEHALTQKSVKNSYSYVWIKVLYARIVWVFVSHIKFNLDVHLFHAFHIQYFISCSFKLLNWNLQSHIVTIINITISFSFSLTTLEISMCCCLQTYKHQ